MSERLAPLKRLEGAQAAAADPRAQVWLSASAGTGKTHVLTARVLRLLLGGADPGAILCLTFTKAGAAEMAERIQARLASWVRLKDVALRAELFALGEPTGDDHVRAARRLFARVLDAPGGGLRIQTIHAFSQTLLAAFPTEAGLAPGFKPLDGRAEAALARATLGRMLVEAERGGDLGLIVDVQALSRRLGEEKAEAYLLDCARVPDAMEALGPRQGIDARVRTALDLWLGDPGDRIAQECADHRFDCGTLRAIAAANAAWGAKTGADHAAIAMAFLAAEPDLRAAMLDDVMGILRTGKGDPRKHSVKLLGCDPDHGENCERLAEALAELIRQRDGAALAALLAAGLRAGQAYARAYAEAKRTAGAVDFDDLIRLTLALLGQPGIGDWIRYKLDRRIDHLLVDEGQDTNLRQWDIVRALTGDFFAAEPEPDEPTHKIRTIFSVGDFKQAIFGFQGTDPAAFALARTYFDVTTELTKRRLDKLSLDRSFRSSPPVLAVVDRLIEAITPQAMGLDDPPDLHRSARADKGGEVILLKPVVVGIESQADDDGPEDGEEGWLDDATRSFATRLAGQIKAWLTAPLWLPAKGRAVRPEDILVLVRRRSDLAALIVARLHAEGVAVAGVDRLRLDAPLVVRDLVAAMRFAIQPDDDLTLANLLVSPLFGLSQDDLYRVAFGRPGTLWQALIEHSDFQPAVGALRGIQSAADFTTPYGFLERILSGELDGRRKLLRRLGGEARDPIDELLNAALLFENEATPTLQRFLDWFDRGEVEVTRDPSAPHDAVRVMTVHGAKGLQAPLVILADAAGDPDTARARRLDWVLDPENDGAPVPTFVPRKAELMGSLADTIAAAKTRERQEHWRLLYVAATRAEEMLVVGGALGRKARGQVPAESWYAKFEGVLADLGADMIEDADWGGRRSYRGERPPLVVVGQRTVAVPAPAAVVSPHWLKTAAPQESRPPRPLAPSSLGDDPAADPPPSQGLRAAAERGRLLHALFERLPAVAPGERLAAAERWLRGAGGLDDANAARAIAADACRVIDDPAFAAIFGPDALAEAPIAAVIADGTVVSGTVDRLLVEEDRVLVIDFKTGRAIPDGPHAVAPYHLRQMAAYVAALGVIFPGRRIEAALLYTAGPMLRPLPQAVLDAAKPDFAVAQQNLALES